jgi:hypothetical protein
VGPISAHPTYLISYSIYYIIIILKKSKIILKNFVIFSYIFLPITHNIGLYIYTVKYKSSIKILGFLRNVSKKIFQNIFKKKIFLLHTAKS